MEKLIQLTSLTQNLVDGIGNIRPFSVVRKKIYDENKTVVEFAECLLCVMHSSEYLITLI